MIEMESLSADIGMLKDRLSALIESEAHGRTLGSGRSVMVPFHADIEATFKSGNEEDAALRLFSRFEEENRDDLCYFDVAWS